MTACGGAAIRIGGGEGEERGGAAGRGAADDAGGAVECEASRQGAAAHTEGEGRVNAECADRLRVGGADRRRGQRGRIHQEGQTGELRHVILHFSESAGSGGRCILIGRQAEAGSAIAGDGGDRRHEGEGACRAVRAVGHEDIRRDLLPGIGEGAVVVEVDPCIQVAGGTGVVRDNDRGLPAGAGGEQGQGHAVFVITGGGVVTGSIGVVGRDVLAVRQGTHAEIGAGNVGSIRRTAPVAEIGDGHGDIRGVIFHLADAVVSGEAGRDDAGEAETGAEARARDRGSGDGEGDVDRAAHGSRGNEDVRGDLFAGIVDGLVVVEVEPGVQVGWRAGGIGHDDRDGGRCARDHGGHHHAVFIVNAGGVISGRRAVPS